MNVSVSEFRQHLPLYLKQVQQGEEIMIANRGKVIARLVPNDQQNKQQLALDKLIALRGQVVVEDVINTQDLENWNHDEDNL